VFPFPANPRPLARYPLSKRTAGKDISNRGLADAQLSNTEWVAGPDGPDTAVQLLGTENSFITMANEGKLHSKGYVYFVTITKYLDQSHR
jgi:hypothetical protein